MSDLPAIRAEILARAKLLGLGTLVALAASALVLAYALRLSGIHSAEERGAFHRERELLIAARDSAIAAADDSAAVARMANERTARAEFARDSVVQASRRRIAAAQAAERVAAARIVVAGAALDATVDSVQMQLPALGGVLEVQVAEDRAAHVAETEAVKEQARALAASLSFTETARNAERLRAESWERAYTTEHAARVTSDELGALLDQRVRELEHPGIFTRIRGGLPWMGLGGALVCLAVCR